MVFFFFIFKLSCEVLDDGLPACLLSDMIFFIKYKANNGELKER